MSTSNVIRDSGVRYPIGAMWEGTGVFFLSFWRAGMSSSVVDDIVVQISCSFRANS
jgi:hypothetical protein